jgi:Transcriptional regulator
MTSVNLYANDLMLFAHVVNAGSFTRAAEITGLPKSTLSRRLSDLEDELGERLMQRSTRRLVLTDFGETILEHARRLIEETDAAAALAQYRQVTPYGTLRVSIPPEFRELAIVEVVSEFSRLYPNVRLEIDLSARRVDLITERFDVAVRAATQLPDDSSLVARRVADMHNALFASPGYIRKYGDPQSPEELLDHHGLILVTGGGEKLQWKLARGDERWEGMPLKTMCANSLALQQALAIKGLGIVGLSRRFARHGVEQGLLQPVLPEWCLPPTAIWCVTAGRRLLPQRTLAFIDLLKRMLSNESIQAMDI